MRRVLGVDLRDALPFIVCAVIFVVLCLVWLVVPLVSDTAGTVSIADSNMTFIRGTDPSAPTIPVLGELPPQSISKVFVTGMLFLLALVYALVSLAASEYRGSLPQLVGLCV